MIKADEIKADCFYTIAEAAHLLGFSPDWVKKEIKDGRLVSGHLGGGKRQGSRLHIHGAELLRFLQTVIPENEEEPAQ